MGDMKESRQEKIIELIEQYEVETQEELAALLNDAGYNVTQATVSRDIKALRLKKVSNGRKSKYIFPADKTSDQNKYRNILQDAYVHVEQASNLVVIKTAAGMAMAAAAALDHLHLEEIVGTIAGDDTIMCAAKSAQEAATLVKKLQAILG